MILSIDVPLIPLLIFIIIWEVINLIIVLLLLKSMSE
jgi:hypothetical protein